MKKAPVESVAPKPVEPEPEAVKKGPLARLADGVSDLFARVTGKKAPEPDQTMEIAADDIIDAARPPRVTGRNPPPDRTMEITMDDVLAADAATPPPIPQAAKAKKTRPN